MIKNIDEKFMRAAIAEAKKAAAVGEVPVGAVVVKDGRVIARTHNLRESKNDAAAHAEIEAVRKAGRKLGTWRLDGCTLYATLEPCPMCAGAAINARIDRVVYGARDPKAGCCGSLYNLPEDTRFNHRPEVVEGVLADECGEILTGFFKEKRK